MVKKNISRRMKINYFLIIIIIKKYYFEFDNTNYKKATKNSTNKIIIKIKMLDRVKTHNNLYG